jgi:signal transduction histidine kinase
MQGEPVKILIVEDSQEDTELLLLELKRGGFEPSYRRVDTPETMAEALDNGPWDVVLSDYSMPRFSVTEALQAVKARNLDVPFLIVSATIVDEEAVAAMKAGAHDFIMKDRLARLAPAITREIQDCQSRRERKTLEEQMRQSQRLESLGLLAGGVAHDFNNLLTGILGNASLALEILNPPEPARSMLESIVQASERAADLTRQLLAYAGKGRFYVRSVNVAAVVREISELMRTSIPRTVKFVLELDEHLPPVEADSTQLQQLVMNLVLNGGEAIGDRTGTLRVVTRLEHLEPGSALTTNGAGLKPGPYICIEVQDTGCGMDDDTLAQIFDPFFSTKFFGRGLGLAAAMGITRGHNGHIEVKSSPGQGSTFRVWLPLAAAPAEAEHKDVHRGAEDLSGWGTVLIIDDEEVVRSTAKAVLERYGYTVHDAVDGRDGLELFQRIQDRVSLILLDLTMPEMSGEETFDQLKSIRPDVPIILTSGYDESEATRRFEGKGVGGFLKKPYTADTLARKIKASLARGRRQMRA